ncbi:hypothetical protein [Chondromyces crocatus]|uniref:Uncharacterized protein n=1 Tax=Chondromyces crocatus TaxID=52 RepID=A0A0K1EK65_CHOCO|nr:hypothetical protein [Chondromyces crocatus]AKT40993.1 uncharacterized protein CMC5_051500 [Chondromyces crocatus]
MAITLSPAQQAVLVQTRALDTPAQFEALLAAARPEIDQVVQEVMAPAQAIDDILIELRDLYLTVIEQSAALATVGYGQGRREAFCAAIQLLDTGHLWFGEGARTGAYRTLNVEDLVALSRPYRARLKAYGAQAFVFEPKVAALFADVNRSRTVAEEIADLRVLVNEARARQARLVTVGVTEAFLVEGEELLRTAESRDLLGILGIRHQDEAILLRNEILTYAVMLGREARAAGVNACFHEPKVRVRFEGASFRQALRRLRPKRRKQDGEVDEVDEVQPPGSCGVPVATSPTTSPTTSARSFEPAPDSVAG